MNETKWLPGPWKVERWQRQYVVVSEANEEQFDDQVICERYCSVGSDRALAEMNLVAAAPDMAEALKALACIPFSDDRNTGSDWDYVETGIRVKDILAARAALAKARGEAS